LVPLAWRWEWVSSAKEEKAMALVALVVSEIVMVDLTFLSSKAMSDQRHAVRLSQRKPQLPTLDPVAHTTTLTGSTSKTT